MIFSLDFMISLKSEKFLIWFPHCNFPIVHWLSPNLSSSERSIEKIIRLKFPAKPWHGRDHCDQKLYFSNQSNMASCGLENEPPLQYDPDVFLLQQWKSVAQRGDLEQYEQSQKQS